MTMFEAVPEQETYAPEEEIRLRLRIVNGTSAAIDLDEPTVRGTQPVFSVRGIEFEKVFTTDSLLKNPFEQKPAPPPRLHVGAGNTWEGTVALRGLSIQAPGEYEVTARLTHSAGESASEPRSFRIAPVVPSVVDLGFGLVRPEGKPEGEIALFHPSAGGTLLYTAPYIEARPDIGAVSFEAPMLREVQIAAGARDVGVARKNAPFNGEIRRWVTWREGARVHALSSADEGLAVTLPAEPRLLVRPPLKEPQGPLDVLALSASGKELQLARFAGGAGRLAWVAPLPAVAESAVAALGPQDKGSPRHFAFASHTQEGISIFHSRYLRDGALEDFKSVRFEPRRPPGHDRPPPRLLAQSTPDLYVDGKDGAWAGFLATDGHELWWLEAHFADRVFRPDSEIQATRLGPLDERPLGGALLYVDDRKGSIARREAVLLLHTGKLLRLKRGILQIAAVRGQVTTPIVLAPGRDATYILCAEPGRGIHLERL